MWKVKAKGRFQQPGDMNKTEKEYSLFLKAEMQASYVEAGSIEWYRFEGIKLKLADRTFYTPDFVVMRKNGDLEMHEVKGFMRDDAAVKIKVAAEQFPFKFFLVKKMKNGWKVEEV